MAKDAPKTPEQIDEMEAEVRAYRIQQQRDEAKSRREAAKPLLDLVETGAIKTILDAMPALERVADDRARFPYLRAYVEATRNSLEQIVALAQSAPDPDEVAQAAEAAAAGTAPAGGA